jgi:hypothetical protein
MLTQKHFRRQQNVGIIINNKQLCVNLAHVFGFTNTMYFSKVKVGNKCPSVYKIMDDFEHQKLHFPEKKFLRA